MNDKDKMGSNPIFNELLDPIMQTIMTQPVIAKDHLTYEEQNIKGWFANNDTSPLTNQKISKVLEVNATLKALLVNNYTSEVEAQKKIQKTEQYEQALSSRLKLIEKQFSANDFGNNLITVLDHHYELPLYIVRILTVKENRSAYFKYLENSSGLRNLKKIIQYFDYNQLNIFFKKMRTPKEFGDFCLLGRTLEQINDSDFITFKKSNLLDFSYEITMRLIQFLNKKKASDTIKEFFENTKLSFNGLKSWQTNQEGLSLFDDLLNYKNNIMTLMKASLTMDGFKGLICFSPEFRQRLFDSEIGDWNYFWPLIVDENAGIPWRKWAALWEQDKEEKQANTEDTISFDEILENEKNKEYRLKFGLIIDLIREAWTKNSIELKNSFYDDVSIQELWDFYNALLLNEGAREKLRCRTGKETQEIHSWLLNNTVTPKKLINLLTQALNNKKPSSRETELINVNYLTQLLDNGVNEHQPNSPIVNKHNQFQPPYQPWSPIVNHISSSSVVKQKSDDTCTYSCFGIGSNCLLTLGCVTGIASGVGQYLQLPKNGTALASLDWKLLFGCMIVACFSIGVDLLIKYKNSHSSKQEYHYHPSQTFMCFFCIAGLASMAGDTLSIYINRHNLSHNHIGIILFSSACALLITSAMIKKCIVEPVVTTQRLNAV